MLSCYFHWLIFYKVHYRINISIKLLKRKCMSFMVITSYWKVKHTYTNELFLCLSITWLAAAAVTGVSNILLWQKYPLISMLVCFFADIILSRQNEHAYVHQCRLIMYMLSVENFFILSLSLCKQQRDISNTLYKQNNRTVCSLLT